MSILHNTLEYLQKPTDHLQKYGYSISSCEMHPIDDYDIQIGERNFKHKMKDCEYVFELRTGNTPICIVCGEPAFLMCDYCHDNLGKLSKLAQKINKKI